VTTGQDAIVCSNFNPGHGGKTKVSSFHETKYCTANPHHEWLEAHQDANFSDPNAPINLSNGFVRANPDDLTHATMGYYTRAELPYYYELAETFAISDRHFCALLGPTLPNRMYLMAATSFGHELTSLTEDIPPGVTGYKPITGVIFDLLDSRRVPWTEFYEGPGDGLTPPRPYGGLFRSKTSPNFQPLAIFFRQAAAGTLSPVVFIDLKNHEHPPLDVRAGQFEVAQSSALCARARTGKIRFCSSPTTKMVGTMTMPAHRALRLRMAFRLAPAPTALTRPGRWWRAWGHTAKPVPMRRNGYAPWPSHANSAPTSHSTDFVYP